MPRFGSERDGIAPLRIVIMRGEQRQLVQTHADSADMNLRPHIWILFLACIAALALVGCGAEETPQYDAPSSGAEIPVAVTVPDLSEKAQAGEALFSANCALCHGANAAGTTLGPPLVHIIYEPNHHQDFSFRSAVQNGVQSHHWQFGNMLPVPTVAESDIDSIICYVRELQRANGIFDDDRGLAVCQT